MRAGCPRWLYPLLILALAGMACQAPGLSTAAPTGAASATPVADMAPATPGSQPSPELLATETPAATPLPDAWAGVDPSGVTVTFWHNYTRARAEVMERLVAEFNHSNPQRIQVQAEFAGSLAELNNRLLPSLGSPEAPDLIVAAPAQIATYWLAGGLVDMRNLVDSPSWGLSADERADLYPVALAQGVFPTLGGELLGIPNGLFLEVLITNPGWLEELGAGAPPATPEEFERLACQAAASPYSAAAGGGTGAGYELSADPSLLAVWTFAFGGDVFDAAGGRFSYDSQAAVGAATFLRGLVEKGCARVAGGSSQAAADFIAGKLLFAIDSSANLALYAGEGAPGLAVAAVPHAGVEPVVDAYAPNLSITRTTPQRELAAWAFLKYLLEPANQAAWSLAGNSLPGRMSAQAGMAERLASDPGYRGAFELLPYARSEVTVAGYDLIRKQAGDTLLAILQGGEARSLLEQLNQDANRILAEQSAP